MMNIELAEVSRKAVSPHTHRPRGLSDLRSWYADQVARRSRCSRPGALSKRSGLANGEYGVRTIKGCM